MNPLEKVPRSTFGRFDTSKKGQQGLSPGYKDKDIPYLKGQKHCYIYNAFALSRTRV